MSEAPHNPPSLPNINLESLTRDDYIGKEHFFDFQLSRSQEFTKTLAGRAFNNCVGGPNPRFSTEPTSWGGRRITDFLVLQPREGLIIAKRTDVGLGQYPGAKPNEYRSLSVVSQEYAIQAGSMLNILPELTEQQSKTDAFLHALTARLLLQFMEG